MEKTVYSKYEWIHLFELIVLDYTLECAIEENHSSYIISTLSTLPFNFKFFFALSTNLLTLQGTEKMEVFKNYSEVWKHVLYFRLFAPG
jgi:hypothetical protein